MHSARSHASVLSPASANIYWHSWAVSHELMDVSYFSCWCWLHSKPLWGCFAALAAANIWEGSSFLPPTASKVTNLSGVKRVLCPYCSTTWELSPLKMFVLHCALHWPPLLQFLEKENKKQKLQPGLKHPPQGTGTHCRVQIRINV